MSVIKSVLIVGVLIVTFSLHTVDGSEESSSLLSKESEETIYLPRPELSSVRNAINRLLSHMRNLKGDDSSDPTTTISPEDADQSATSNNFVSYVGNNSLDSEEIAHKEYYAEMNAFSRILNINQHFNVSGLQEGDMVEQRRKNAVGIRWTKTHHGAHRGLVRIPYRLSNVYNERHRAIIQSGIAVFARHTCIRFYPRHTQSSYLNIRDGQGCYAYVGKAGGAQTVSLSRIGCVQKGVVIHELMHAIGFVHEQSRSDRDRYIRILNDNVPLEYQRVFLKERVSRNYVPYDYGSIMHYGKLSFSKKPFLPVMEIIPKQNPEPRIGQRSRMSPYDIEEIKYYYGCSAGTYRRCGRDFDGRLTGSFQSPSYPAAYPKESHCTWYINVRSGRYVTVTFSNIDIYDSPLCQADAILVHDGRNAGAPFLRKICGKITSNIQITSTGQSMFIIFSSDTSQRTNKGFRATFRESSTRGRPANPLSVPTLPPIRQTVNRFQCDFERSICGMHQDRLDAINFHRNRGTTRTRATGPTGDDSPTGRGYYIYIESSLPALVGDNAIIRTPWFDRSDRLCISFSYHMFGVEMGGLQLYAFEKRRNSNRGYDVRLWEKYDDQGRMWIRQNYLYRPRADVEFVQFYWQTYVYLFESDIALDNIDVKIGSCSSSGVTSRPTVRPTAMTRIIATSVQTRVQSSINCTFENGVCGFIQSKTDKFDWTIRSGSTPTRLTGPSGDHTTGSGHYMYIEASAPRIKDQVAQLDSPPLTPGKHCLHMWYHMYGTQVGKLTISQSVNGVKTILTEKQGDKGNRWHPVTLEINSQTRQPQRNDFGEDASNFQQAQSRITLKLVIEATIGEGFAGDIAIDDIVITENGCAPPSVFSCDFESNAFCGMSQARNDNFDWTRSSRPGSGTPSLLTGPSTDRTPGLNGRGHFVYIEASSPRVNGNYADIFTPPLAVGNSKRCVTFWYHMWGTGMGTLHVFTDFTSPQRRTASGSTLTSNTVHTLRGNQGQVWNMARVEIEQDESYYEGSVQIRFRGMRGLSSKSDIAIDDICTAEGSCDNTNECYLESALSSTTRPIATSIPQTTSSTTRVTTTQVTTKRILTTASSTTTPRRTTGPSTTTTRTTTNPSATTHTTTGTSTATTRTTTNPSATTHTTTGTSTTTTRTTTNPSATTHTTTGASTATTRTTSEPPTSTISARVVTINAPTFWSGMPLCTFENRNQVRRTNRPGAIPGDSSRDRGEYVYPRTITHDVMCGWNQRRRDQFDWRRHAGSTFTQGTGPSRDRTNSRGHYLYIESSRPQTRNDVASLQTYRMPPTEYCIDLYYHMLGATIGRLSVCTLQRLTNGQSAFSYLHNITGSQGGTWKHLRVQYLPHETALSVAFLIDGVVGRDYRGDIAIDDITILPGRCDVCQNANLRFVDTLGRERKFSTGCVNSELFWVRCCSLTQEKAVYRRVARCDANMFSTARLDWYCNYSI